jgi:hypothetical protein
MRDLVLHKCEIQMFFVEQNAQMTQGNMAAFCNSSTDAESNEQQNAPSAVGNTFILRLP